MSACFISYEALFGLFLSSAIISVGMEKKNEKKRFEKYAVWSRDMLLIVLAHSGTDQRCGEASRLQPRASFSVSLRSLHWPRDSPPTVREKPTLLCVCVCLCVCECVCVRVRVCVSRWAGKGLCCCCLMHTSFHGAI